MAGDYGDTSGGPSDQTIRDIVAQLNPAPPQPIAAPVGVMPAPEVTPTMLQGTQGGPGLPMNIVPAGAQAAAPSTIPGPDGYSEADRFNKFSLPAGGGPLSVDDANKVIASYESTGGHAFAPPTSGAPAAARRPAPDDWAPPVPVFTPPPVAPLGVMAALPRPAAPILGQVLGRR